MDNIDYSIIRYRGLLSLIAIANRYRGLLSLIAVASSR